jgi:predicted TIM-barrel fold metal-dependent hydrolase
MLGIDRVVFTQPSVYGIDNSAILDAMAKLNAETANRARAVVAVAMDIRDDELAAFEARGARGVRLNADNKGGMPIEMSAIPELAARMRRCAAHRVSVSRQRPHRTDADVGGRQGADLDCAFRLSACDRRRKRARF